MKLVIIFGPHAVGKMTVGHEIEKITELKLFHNHMTIDLVGNFFNYGTEQGKKLVRMFRRAIFEEVAKSELEGMIFTYVWAFSEKSDWEYIEMITGIFKDQGGEVFYVELEADMDERLIRNKSEHRLLHKPSKRDTEHTEKWLKKDMERFRLNSEPGEITKEDYIRINNTNLAPDLVAQKIREVFNL